ncbi:MAG: hypothetical protein LC630_06960, partial [Bacteroidales bacterium]|nr:hypothetical protein [Bacteroidales bacterium]
GEALAMAGRKEDAEKMFTAIVDNALASLTFITSLPDDKTYGLDFTVSVSLQALLDIYRKASAFSMNELATRASVELSRYYGEVPLR